MSLTYAQPQYFRVMFGKDPATSLKIGWSQDLVGTATEFKVYYSENDHGTDLNAYAEDNQPVDVSRTVPLYKGLNHYFADLEGLKPKTAYYFVVAYSDPSGGISGVSPRYWSKTVSDQPDQPISIIAGGDSRLNLDEGPERTLESITIRKEANIIVSKLRPDMVAFGGDYTFANLEIEWIQWFQDWALTYTEDGKITPIVTAMGNHEALPFGCPQCGNEVIYNLFDTPNEEVYYALSFGGNLLRLYTMNTEMTIAGAQTDWLVDDLANNFSLWKMAQYHKPMRPHEAGKSDKNDAYDNWALPFYEQQVRLVVECDAHVVKSTWPLIPTTAPEGELLCGETIDANFARTRNGKGITFVGEGTWAALRDADDPKEWTRDMGTLNQVKWIWVSQDQIDVRTVQTYKAEDLNYATNVTALSEENRFMVPDGLTIWETENGDVLSLFNNANSAVPENPCQTVGINDINLNNEAFTLIPNPSTNGKITLRFNQIISSADIEIFTLDGQLIFKDHFNQGNIQIDLGSERKGAVLVSAKTNSGDYLQKLILK